MSHQFPFSSWIPQPDDPMTMRVVRTMREAQDRTDMALHRARAEGTRAAENMGVEILPILSRRHPPIVLGRRRDNLLTWALLGAAAAALLLIAFSR